LEEELARNGSLYRKTGREVGTHKVDGATDDEPWNLRDTLAEDESRPMISFRLHLISAIV
jgi:hypothetical protein